MFSLTVFTLLDSVARSSEWLKDFPKIPFWYNFAVTS